MDEAPLRRKAIRLLETLKVFLMAGGCEKMNPREEAILCLLVGWMSVAGFLIQVLFGKSLHHDWIVRIRLSSVGHPSVVVSEMSFNNNVQKNTRMPKFSLLPFPYFIN